MSEQIRREFTLAFPIDKVKTAIDDACRTSQKSYTIQDRNAAFNSYSVLLVKNLHWLPITITLRATSENETHFELSAIPGPQLSRMVTFTTSLIEDFLKQVGDYASGKYVAQPDGANEQASSNKGCAILFVIAGAAAIAAMYFGFK